MKHAELELKRLAVLMLGTGESDVCGRFGVEFVGFVGQNSVVHQDVQLSCQQKILRGGTVLDLGVERTQVLW